MRCVIGVSGVYDVLDCAAHLSDRGLPVHLLYEVMSRPELGSRVPLSSQLASWSPTLLCRQPFFHQTRVACDYLPNVFLIHGRQDQSSHWTQTEHFARALASAGARVLIKYYEFESHTDPIIEAPMLGKEQLIRDILKIIKLDDEITDAIKPADKNDLRRREIEDQRNNNMEGEKEVEGNGMSRGARVFSKFRVKLCPIDEEVHLPPVPLCSPFLVKLARFVNPF